MSVMNSCKSHQNRPHICEDGYINFTPLAGAVTSIAVATITLFSLAYSTCKEGISIKKAALIIPIFLGLQVTAILGIFSKWGRIAYGKIEKSYYENDESYLAPSFQHISSLKPDSDSLVNHPLDNLEATLRNWIRGR